MTFEGRRCDVEIVPFQPSFQSDVSRLIVGIQRDEFGIEITAEQQPDLLDIGDRQGALRKMFVQREFRGPEQGAAKRLLDALLASADEKRVREIFLGTTALFFRRGGSRVDPPAHE